MTGNLRRKLQLCLLFLGSLLCTARAQHPVLVENFTGAWCGNCPYGDWALDSIKQRLGDSVIILNWHQGDSLAIPAQDTLGGYLGISAYPTIAINRQQIIPQMSLQWRDSNAWYAGVREAKANTDLRLKVIPEFSQNRARIIITPYKSSGAIGLDTEGYDYFVAAYVVQDSIVLRQRIYNDSVPYREDFVHSNVVRYSSVPVLGQPITAEEILGGNIKLEISGPKFQELGQLSTIAIIGMRSKNDGSSTILSAVKTKKGDWAIPIGAIESRTKSSVAASSVRIAGRRAYLDLFATRAGQATFIVADILGNSLVQNLIELGQGRNNEGLALPSLPAGVYICLVLGAGINYSRAFEMVW